MAKPVRHGGSRCRSHAARLPALAILVMSGRYFPGESRHAARACRSNARCASAVPQRKAQSRARQQGSGQRPAQALFVSPRTTQDTAARSFSTPTPLGNHCLFKNSRMLTSDFSICKGRQDARCQILTQSCTNASQTSDDLMSNAEVLGWVSRYNGSHQAMLSLSFSPPA